MDEVKAIVASDVDSTRGFFEVEPYQQVRLGSTPWVVYHQGDEEQTAIVAQDGSVELRGPHDWTVTFEVPVS